MNTKEKIINTAAEMLSDNGFNAFSFHDISREIGIKTSSIHYYFPTKSDLIIEVIRYSQRIQTALFASIADKTPSEKLVVLIDFYVDLARKGQMCPIVSISSDMKDIDPNIKDEVSKFYDFLADWLTSLLADGIHKKHFVCAQRPANKAIELLNILAMLPILSRLGKGAESIARIKQSLIDNLLNPDDPGQIPAAPAAEITQKNETIAHLNAVIVAQKKVIALYEANDILQKWETQK